MNFVVTFDLEKRKILLLVFLSHCGDFGHVRYKKCIYCHIDVNFVFTFDLEKERYYY